MTENESIDERLETLRSEDPEIWTVSDDDRVVQLSVDVQGKLETLRLAPQWWRTVSAEEIGPLVLRLLRASAASRNQTIAELADAVPDTADDRTVATMEDAGPHDRSGLTARLGNLLAAFSEVDHYRRSVEEATRESTRLQSPSGNVTLEVVGGSPRSLVIDPFNVQFTPEQTLASEIVELFAQADRWLGDRRDRVLGELPELADVVSSVRARTRRTR